MAPVPRPEIRQLTGLRFIAASAVVVFHYRDLVAHLFPGFSILDPLTSAGRMGVDLFFALSGFILTYVYLEWLSVPDLRRIALFLRFRLARIYPVHVLTIGLVAAGVVASSAMGQPVRHPEHFTVPDLLRNLAMVHAWSWQLVESWNQPSWSISSEWFAYLWFPFLAAGVARVTSVRGLVAIACAVVGAQFGLAAAAGLEWDANALLRIAGAFVMGSCLGRIFLLLRPGGGAWRIAVIGLLALAVAIPLLTLPNAPARAAMVPVFGLIVFALAMSGPRGVAAWLASAPLVFLGEISYSLYMTHAIVGTVAFRLLQDQWAATAPGPIRAALLLLVAAAVLAAATATYVFIERPARTNLRRPRFARLAPA